MGTIKDIIDLITDLSKRINDRKIVSELQNVQRMVLEIQAEQAKMHESNIELREENQSLKKTVRNLKDENSALKDKTIDGPEGVPACPNCSTASKPFYMAPIPAEFRPIEDASHECPQCHYKSYA